MAISFFDANTEIENFQLICRYLIGGKSVYYSDLINSRVGTFSQYFKIDQHLNEFSRSSYLFLHNNFDEFKRIMEIIGYQVLREEHTLSIQPEYKYYYYIVPIEIQGIKKGMQETLNRGDILFLSALMIATNMGTQFIEYDAFLTEFLEDPQRILKRNTSLEEVAKIVSPSIRITSSEELIKKLIVVISKRVKNILRRYNYVQILTSRDSINLVSLGPAVFRFTRILRDLNQKIDKLHLDEKNEEEE